VHRVLSAARRFFLLFFVKFLSSVYDGRYLTLVLIFESVCKGFKDLLHPFTVFCAGVLEDGAQGIRVIQGFLVGDFFGRPNPCKQVNLVSNDSNY
jgi:hypothetical protein